ncbi:hypothetical protein CapIbe_014016 [Capra ibex]
MHRDMHDFKSVLPTPVKEWPLLRHFLKGASVLESAACGVAEGSDGSSEESLHLMPEIQPTVALTHSNSACYLHQHLYRAGNSGFRRLIALCV